MQHLGQKIDVVWFKRDLRIRDHAPLAQALRDGRRVLLLHTFEPADLAHPTTSNRHLTFRWQAWTSLCAEVSALGWPVETAVLVAPALEVLKHMHNSAGISALYSYEETGLAHTFDRDKEIARWARDKGIDWHEQRQ
ncbi:MAG: deoxyribodipyrimidine photo-lyase, partial [Flavobacteriales bacterium]